MKILYVITKSNWGGAQKYVYDLAREMKNSGAEVEVALGGDGELAKRLEAQDIKVYRIKNLVRDVGGFRELKVARELYSLFRRERPDLVHLNSSKIGALGSLIARLARVKKIIFTAHGWPFREERKDWQKFLIKFLSWVTVIFSHKIICVSKKDFTDAEHWAFSKNKLVVVHNGIEIYAAKPKKNSEANVVGIVSIVELHKNKGLEIALEVVNELREKVKNFKYTILSYGGDEAENLAKAIVEKDLENYIDLVISEKNLQASQELRNYDIYLLTSVKEGLPYVILEAGESGLATVASDVGGVSEIIENGENGFLVPVRDVQSFVLFLSDLVRNKNLREDLGERARVKVEENFSLEKMVRETKSVYILK